MQNNAVRDFDRVFLVSAGKAATSMANAVHSRLSRKMDATIVVTKYGHGAGSPATCRLFEAAHPVPDRAGCQAVAAITDLLRTLNARDLLIVALSGGASALLCDPAPPIKLAKYRRTTDLLLRAGANISELNAVRKHISALKGGQMAALAYPATTVGLILSDVIGDPLDVIASGPTAPDPTTFADAIAVIERFRLMSKVPATVRAHLQHGLRGELPETPKPGDPVFAAVRNTVVGSNRLALEAGARVARRLGYHTAILASTFSGEARELGAAHAAILREVVTHDRPVRAPACILSGGEPTVTVRGDGLGGRAQEFALAAAIALAGLPSGLVLSAGTDGTDGPTDAAGAIATPDTLHRARASGIDAQSCLRRNDSYHFFSGLGDLVKTGPTGTNVMDVNILLAGKK